MPLLVIAVLLGVGAVVAIVLAVRSRRDSRPSLVRETVIERQVLVMRCRFCGALTPVDLDACDRCGAGLV